ncbi:MAG: polysaccharide biosynthesis tyrosine autokinase [Planctomycetes bacterium]|nr:polysaccharide biosynthesis tyrosine autokinase [Planctomycetota bacterium]
MNQATAPRPAEPHHGTFPQAMPPAHFDLREALRIVSAQRWLVATTLLLVVAATALLTFTATPYYRAKMRVLIERHTSNPTSFQEIYQLGTATDDYYSTQHKILESRAIAAAALASMSETDRATYARAPGSDPVDEFLRLRQILPVPKSRLVDVAADHPDRAVAARAAQALVGAYIQNGLSRLENASSEALTRLQKDAESLQKKLIAAEAAVQEYRRANELVITGDRRSLVATRLEKLTDELAEIERARSDAAARLRSVDARATDASWSADVPEVLENPVIANCKRALLDARAERSQLAQIYRAQHPRLLALANRIEAVEAQLHQEIDSVHHGLARQLERAESRAADVQARIAEQSKALLELESRTSQHALLVEEAEATRKLHDTVLNRLKEVQLIQGAEQTNVHAIGEAEISHGPVRPNKLLNLLLACAGGLVLALGLAFGIDACDRTLKTEEDIARVLGLPQLGLVPRLSGKRPEDGRIDPESLDERSAVSEAFRTIRTNLAFRSKSQALRTLTVTSAAPSEGKSTVAINLAIAFARSGKRVLLVDADMRRPRLHRAFGQPAGEGFSSLLIGTRMLADLVRPTAVANLALLPCGAIPPNPLELLGSPGMQTALAAMQGEFDLVVFDSPPVGVVSDTCVLGTLVDHVLFVVRSCRTNRTHARRALGQLLATSAAVAGTVVNHSDVRAHRYSEYSVDYSYRSKQPRDVEAEAEQEVSV